MFRLRVLCYSTFYIFCKRRYFTSFTNRSYYALCNRTVAVDTTKAFKDIKGPEKLPHSLYLKYCPGLALGAVALYRNYSPNYLLCGYAHLKNKKPKEVTIETPKSAEPHVKALLAAGRTKYQKIMARGQSERLPFGTY